MAGARLKVDDLRDARLDDELGALVAGEHGDVHRAARQGGLVRVEHRIHLGVADVGVPIF